MHGDAGLRITFVGSAIAYSAGGIPTGWRSLNAVWTEHALDVDLLMIAAAIAAAAVGAYVEALMALRPEKAFRRSADGAVEEVAAAALVVGNVVALRLGARVMTDGTIVAGRGSLDESNITGESMPARKEPGSKVRGGLVV